MNDITKTNLKIWTRGSVPFNPYKQNYEDECYCCEEEEDYENDDENDDDENDNRRYCTDFNCNCKEYCDCSCDCTWSENIFRKEYEQMTIDKNSDPRYVYECHPFVQGKERTPSYYNLVDTNRVDVIELYQEKDNKFKFSDLLNFNEFETLKNCKEQNIEYGIKIIWDNKIVYVTDCVSYIVTENSKILSVFQDKSLLFQQGDGGTLACSYDNYLIIHNIGDVSSIVVIKEEDTKEVNNE